MHSITFPEIKTTDYLLDIYNFRNKEKTERFTDCTGIMLLYERLYAAKAARNELNHLQPGNPIEDYVSKSELMDLYDNKFVKEKGRDFYLKIRKSINICPTCLIRDVEQVDHYLPKSEYPIFSVSISNLVPICEKCNGIKKTNVYDIPLLHPYFDNVSDYEWLFVNIIYSKGIGFEYFVEVPSTQPELRERYQNRIDNHMKKLNLYETYASKASELHSSLLPGLKNVYKAGGKFVVEELLKGLYEGATKKTENCFDAALYKALLNEDYISNYLSKV